MAVIALEGMRFFAHHGLYEEERILGNHFIMDIFIDTDISKTAVVVEHDTEKVEKTVNYETVYEICRLEMSKPQKLLEDVVKRTIAALQTQFQNIERINIKVKKLNPPLRGYVSSSSVEAGETFVKQCGRCGSPMICYTNKPDACWCREIKQKIHPRTAEMLVSQYKGCLCKKCLEEYAG
jgi:7,8-dihydroneopterin aldolase/epimerase/oxygenase